MIEPITIISVGSIVLITAFLFLNLGKREAYIKGFHDGYISCSDTFAKEIGIEIKRQRKFKAAIMERLNEGEDV